MQYIKSLFQWSSAKISNPYTNRVTHDEVASLAVIHKWREGRMTQGVFCVTNYPGSDYEVSYADAQGTLTVAYPVSLEELNRFFSKHHITNIKWCVL